MVIERFVRENKKILRSIRVGSIDHQSIVEDLADPDADAASGWWQSFLRGGSIRSLADRPVALRIVDAFSGCGGLSLGVSLAAISCGFKPQVNAAIDMDPDALAVFGKNLHPN